MTEGRLAGWDLGGAHLKAARVAVDGTVEDVIQIPCPLWQGPEHLEKGVDDVLARFGPVERHAVTMTGELVDFFDNRTEGVAAIVDAVAGRLAGADVRIYAGRKGFLSPGEAGEWPLEIASANWLASASYTARKLDNALFMDLGSTTTDIAPCSRGEALVRGYSDSQRMAEDELVYTGLTRTPIMAVTDRAPFDGAWRPMMAEYFATMADVHRVTGMLREEADQYPAADGRGKTPEDSARRLARMIGCDLGDADMEAWRGLAEYFSECQRRGLHDACMRVLSRARLEKDAPLVGAGVGRAVLRDLAVRMGRPYVDFGSLVAGEPAIREAAADSAPAVSVALLLESP